MGHVAENRWRQEQTLRAQHDAVGRPIDAAMSRTEIDHFVALFERLTRRMMGEMPARADALIEWRAGFDYVLQRLGRDGRAPQK